MHIVDDSGWAGYSPSFTSAQESYVREFTSRYRRRTATSREIALSNRVRLADPLRPMDFHPLFDAISYPITAVRSLGSHFWDADSNMYVDFSMASGSALFGHAPEFLRKALVVQIEKGFAVGPQTRLAGEVARLVCDLTGAERVAFACSGTEAVMLALRLARTVSLRETIAVFAGSFHGHYDATLAIEDPYGAAPAAFPAVPGVLPAAVQSTVVLDYGETESLDFLRTHGEDVAAVLVEPIPAHRPVLAPLAFLRELRAITEQHSIALIFDEMITGFRMAPGGAQESFGVRADLAVYGKAVAGGLPIGLIAGKARYLDAVDGGSSSFHDSSRLPTLTTMAVGTFAKHPLSLAAAHATLQRLVAAGPELQEKLNQQTTELAAALNQVLHKDGATLRFAHFGSYFGPAPPFHDTSSMAVRLLYYHLIERGVYLTGLVGFLSTAHCSEDRERLVSALQESLQQLRQAGFQLESQ